MPDKKSTKFHSDKLTDRLQIAIRIAVRLLAVLMTIVIILGVFDVAWTLHQRAMDPPKYILTISDMLTTFGAFMAVLIAIEIFVNITVYLREDVIHVKIVMATALMAVARKIIVIETEKVSSLQLFGLGFVLLAVSVGYWLVVTQPGRSKDGEDDEFNPLPKIGN